MLTCTTTGYSLKGLTGLLALAGIFTLLGSPTWPQGAQAQNPSQGPNFIRVETGDLITDTGASGAAWIDFDNDGDDDAFLVGTAKRLRVYRNDGQGMFTKLSLAAFDSYTGTSWGLSGADYDNDGDVDVFVAGAGSSALFRNEGNGTFALAGDAALTGSTGWSPAWADYDNDGNVDLSIIHPAGFTGPPTPNHLFHNDGPPNYTLTRVEGVSLTTGLAPYTVGSWADFDQDGDVDLFIGSGPATGTLAPDYFFRNLLKPSGATAFERITEFNWAMDARDGQVPNWIDYDNDGDMDLYITNWGGQLGGYPNELYRNDGGVYTKITDGAIVTDRDVSLANTWGDFDNDGDLDVFVANGGQNRPDRFYLNNGDGTFTSVTTGVLATDIRPGHWTAAISDYDNDGDLDVLVPSIAVALTNSLYRNDLANGNHWLKIRLVGASSNRSAVGAIIKATAIINGKTVTQIRDVNTQNTFLGHNSLDVHFGLADATIANSLVIQWPSGRKDEYNNVAANQFIRITETGIISKIRQ